MNIVNEIRELKAKKLNNAEIAEHIGISESQVRKILSGDESDFDEYSHSGYADETSYYNDGNDENISDILNVHRGQNF